MLSVRLRLGALALLASVLPLAVLAPTPTGSAASTRPAAWLRAQVGVAEGAAPARQQDARAAFDRALKAAAAADTRTLHDFLTVFLDAHASMTEAEAPATDGRSPQALLAELRQQLAQTGLDVRPPTQLSAPPTAPQQRARWAAASLFVPLPDHYPAGEAEQRRPSLRLGQAVASSVQYVAAPVARSVLFRALFAGRRLGP